MSTGGPAVPEHPVPTRNHGYRYQFHPKHHDPSRRDVAQWLPEMSREEEFGVFDLADDHYLCDEKDNLFGLRPRHNGELPDLGTLGQQIARFPHARPSEPWHGYPLAVLRLVREPSPPEREIPVGVLRQMVAAGLLDEDECKRLGRGKHT